MSSCWAGVGAAPCGPTTSSLASGQLITVQFDERQNKIKKMCFDEATCESPERKEKHSSGSQSYWTNQHPLRRKRRVLQVESLTETAAVTLP